MSVMFAFKLLLVPLFILGMSLAGRRWGAGVSGWLVGLPVVAGPIVFFIGREQGDAFASGAAHGTLTGIVSLMLYCLAYSRAAARFGWAVCLLTGWAVFLVSTYFLNRLPLSLAQSFLLVLAAMACVLALLPESGPEGTPPGTPSWEIVARMGAAVALVFLTTTLAPRLGPNLAGLLVPFPVAATVMTVFTHRYQGRASAVRLLRGLVCGLWTMALFFLIVSETVVRMGVEGSFAVAAAVDVGTHGGAFWVMRRYRASRIPS